MKKWIGLVCLAALGGCVVPESGYPGYYGGGYASTPYYTPRYYAPVPYYAPAPSVVVAPFFGWGGGGRGWRGGRGYGGYGYGGYGYGYHRH